MIIKVRGKENSYWHLFDKVSDLSYKNIGPAASDLNDVDIKREVEDQHLIKILKEEVSDDDTYFLQFLKEKEGYNLIFNTYGFVMNDQGETIEKIGQKGDTSSEGVDDEFKLRYQKLAGIKDNDPEEYNETKKNTVNNGVRDFRSRKLNNVKEDIKEMRRMSQEFDQSDLEDFINEKTETSFETDVFRSDEVETPKDIEDFFEENDIDPVDHKKSEFTDSFTSGVEKERYFKNIREEDIPEDQKEKINKFYDKGADQSNEVEDVLNDEPESSDLYSGHEGFVNKQHPANEVNEYDVDLDSPNKSQEGQEVSDNTKRVTFDSDSEEESEGYKTVRKRINDVENLREELGEESELSLEDVEEFIREHKGKEKDLIKMYIENLDNIDVEEAKDEGYFEDFIEDTVFDSSDDFEDMKEGFKRVAGIPDEEAEEAAEKLREFQTELDEGAQEYRDDKARKIAENVRKAQERVSKDNLKAWLKEKDDRVLKVYPGDKDVEDIESASFDDWKELKGWCEGNGYDIEDLVFTDLSDNIQPVTLEKSGTKRVVFGTEPGFEYEGDN